MLIVVHVNRHDTAADIGADLNTRGLHIGVISGLIASAPKVEA